MPQQRSTTPLIVNEQEMKSPFAINKIFSRIWEQISAIQGSGGPFNFKEGLKAKTVQLTAQEDNPGDLDVVTFGFLKKYFSPQATRAALISRTWRNTDVQPLPTGNVTITPPPPGGGSTATYNRTLLLKDTTVSDDVADHVPVFVSGRMRRIIGVLRKTIDSDLTVQFNKDGIEMATCTIPSTQAVDDPIVYTTFVNDPEVMGDLQVLSADILDSDGQIDAAGVASFTVQWDPN